MNNVPQIIDIPGLDDKVKVNQELAVSQKVINTAERQGNKIEINYNPTVNINVSNSGNKIDNSVRIRTTPTEVDIGDLGVEHKELLTVLKEMKPPRWENFQKLMLTSVLGQFRTQKDAAEFLGISKRSMCYKVKIRRAEITE